MAQVNDHLKSQLVTSQAHLTLKNIHDRCIKLTKNLLNYKEIIRI